MTVHGPALLITDIQPDFMPGGALPVAGGDEIVAPIRAIMQHGGYAALVATQDWHPRGHISFASAHMGHHAFDTISLYGHEQVLWPDHCVQGTSGAALTGALPWERVDVIVRKGTDPLVDAYSAFRNNWDAYGTRVPTGLAGYLRERGIGAVHICGLARDFCVKWSAEDAAELGFETTVLWTCSRSVAPAHDARLGRELQARGIRIVESDAAWPSR